MKELRKKDYKAFTLIEMLIVMGILIVLMGAGLAGGRYAIRQAQYTARRSSVKSLEVALISYYAQTRQYPRGDGSTSARTPRRLVSTDLARYLDGEFDGGGTDGIYYYIAQRNPNRFLICATYTSILADGGYCAGDIHATDWKATNLSSEERGRIQQNGEVLPADAAAFFGNTNTFHATRNQSGWRYSEGGGDYRFYNL